MAPARASAGRRTYQAVLLCAACGSTFGEWTVETNSFRVKEPSDLIGEYDAAIGDVRFPSRF